MQSNVLIPVSRYTSSEFQELETTRLWNRVWQLVCREDEVAESGAYFEYSIGNRSYLIVRDHDRSIRAFHNVCPHRANLLRTGAGNTGAQLVCPFHMWTFGLDGSLKAVSDRETFCAIDDAAYGLRPLRADTWNGWVFVHPDPDRAEPLAEYLAPVTELVAGYHLDRLIPVGLNLTTTVSANWKVGVESFIEVYHIHALHPQLLPTGDDLDMFFEHWTHHSRMVRPYGVPSGRLGPADGIDPDEILESIFGPRPAANGETPAFAVDPSTRRNVSDAWERFDRYRDESGAIVFPDGLTLRDVLADFYQETSRRRGIDFSTLRREQFIDNSQFLLFPNIVVNVNVTSIMLFRFLPHPTDPNCCTWDIFSYDWIVDPVEATTRRAPRRVIGEFEESLGLLMDQDIAQMPRVQRGLRSGSIDHITLSQQENRIAHFHRVLDRYLDAE